jgi:signal transduction histidine kinase
MKHLCIASLLFLLVGPVAAQNTDLDAVNRRLAQATTDTARVNLNVLKSKFLLRVNLDSAHRLTDQTVALARRIGYRRGEAQARIKRAAVLCFKGNYAAARQDLRSAEGMLSALRDSAAFGVLYSTYGTLQGMQSQYDSSVVFYEKAIRVAQAHNDRELLSTVYQNLANSHQMQSRYSVALTYYQKSLQIAEEDRDLSAQAYALLNIGLAERTIGYLPRAEQSLLRAIQLAKQAGVRIVELYAYTNLASLYSTRQNPSKSYQFAVQGERLAAQIGDLGMRATCLSWAALARSAQKKYASAEAMVRKAMALADSSNQPLNRFQAYAMMGAILKAQAKYAAALPYFETAFSALTQADLYDEQVGEAYANLALCYEKTGQYPKALTAFRTSAEIADSIRRRENIRNATEQQLTFEFDQRQAVERAKQELAAAESTSRQWVLGIGLVLALVLTVFIFLGYRAKERDNALLEQQKAEIQRTLTQLKATQAQLIQSEKMASLGELTAGIAHEIQNPLNFVNNFSEVSAELVGELKEELQADRKPEALELADDLTQNLERITLHGQRAASIVRGMLEHSRTSSGEKTPTDLNALAEEYLRLAYHGLRAKDKSFNADLKTEFAEALPKINLVPQDLGRVVLNLITNAFHAVSEKAKRSSDGYQPEVTVRTRRLDGYVEIQVQDNGTGVPEAVREKIFQPFFTTKPTGQGTGLGLSLAYDIVTKGHGGTLTVESQEGVGTEFIVRIPA